MCDDDLDTILSYLSSKINRIFCDREFVGCVKEDFDIIVRNSSNHCVVFPKLKPIFLKVLRHQAVIFDLSVFCIGSGPNQLAVVCKKAFLKEQSDECPVEENKQGSKAMDGEENFDKTHSKKSSRINRPTQTYYVPPAQRSTTKKKVDHENNKTSNKTRIKSKSKHKDTEKQSVETKEEAFGSNVLDGKTIPKDKIMQEELVPSHTLCGEFANSTFELPTSIEQEECGACLDVAELPNSTQKICTACLDVEECLCSLSLLSPNINEFSQIDEEEKAEECSKFPPKNLESQFSNLPNELVQNKNSYSDKIRNTVLDISRVAPPETNEHVDHTVEVQKLPANPELLTEFVENNQIVEDNQNVQNSTCTDSENGSDISNESFKIKLGSPDLQTVPETILQQCTKNPELPEVVDNVKIQQRADNKISSLSSNEGVDDSAKLLETSTEEDIHETKTNGFITEQSEEVLMQNLLTYLDASHFIAASDDNCVDRESDSDLPGSVSNTDGDGNSNMDSLLIIPPPLLEEGSFHIVDPEQMHSDSNCSDTPPLYISYNDDISKKKTADCDIDNENEEMQRVIENINRKSRSLIKHNIRNVSTLRIDENEHVPQHTSDVYENNKTCLVNTSESNSTKEDPDNLSNWEDMFDETGDLQPEYIGKIVKRIGCDVKIVKASHDYSAYQNTKCEDLEHVIELYDFPSTFKTQDLIQLYRGASQDPMYIKWCDDTHALLVLSTPAQAQRALQITHEVIKARPLSEASPTAALTASGGDLKPAMKRPQTSMQTARRLINTHLGTKSTLSKEEIEQERRALREAREQRRQERQNEKDAWEGRPRSSKSHPFS